MTSSSEASSKTVRVVHLIGSLDVGGAESVALDLCRRIPSEQVHQTFVCLSGRKGTLAPDFERCGADVLPLPIRPFASLPWRFGSVIRQVRPRCLVSHVSLASAPFLLAARFLRVPQRVARLHNNADDHGTHLARRAYRSLMRVGVYLGATHVLGVTSSANAFGLGRWAVRAQGSRVVATIPNGVDADRFTPTSAELPRDRVDIVHVGRVAPQKNRKVLPAILDAVDALKPATLRIVGTWDTHDIGSVSRRLINVGPTRDVVRQLHSAHVSVLPSLWEGLPGVVLESLACGVPVVASDLPGTRWIASECAGVTLIPADAPVSEWAHALVAAAETSFEQRATIRSSLVTSPFSLHENVVTWTRLWTDGTPGLGGGTAPGRPIAEGAADGRAAG